MRIIGIIAEYNPFHEGHAYQLRQAKEVYGADAVVIVMSGDTVQRGEFAMLDKYERAKTAVAFGADLVLMLPSLFSASGAGDFAAAGVTLLEKTCIVDTLLFGAEQADPSHLFRAAEILTKEPPRFREVLQSGLSRGLSYPAAREKAVRKAADEDFPEGFFSSPNTLLGVEYIRRILSQNLSLTPLAMKRNESFLTAAALRKRLREASSKEDALAALSPALSKELLSPLLAAAEEKELLFPDDASLLLHAALLQREEYKRFYDCTVALSNRIKNRRDHFSSWTDFISELKTKELTYTRISRVLLHILLDTTWDTVNAAKETAGIIPYLRVLAFSEAGKTLLSEIKRNAALPLITRPKEAASLLSDEAYAVFEQDLFAAALRRALLTEKTKKQYPTDLTRYFQDTVNDETAEVP